VAARRQQRHILHVHNAIQVTSSCSFKTIPDSPTQSRCESEITNAARSAAGSAHKQFVWQRRSSTGARAIHGPNLSPPRGGGLATVCRTRARDAEMQQFKTP
jgi:hypothetical protein